MIIVETNITNKKQADTTDKDKEKNKKTGWEIKKILKQKVRTSIENNQISTLFKFLKKSKKQKIK